MGRPSQIESQRKKLLPIVARAFSDLGYRRATTAELARRCGVRENILYRIWKDKKDMFVASIRYVFELSERIWTERAREASPCARAETLLEYEAEHLGEFGHYRIVFAGLNETDDPEIRGALASMYRSFHAFVRDVLGSASRGGAPTGRSPAQSGGAGRSRSPARADPELGAWVLVAVGTLASIGRELRILSAEDRKRLLREVGQAILGR
jgi:AcrR family transcriptional regulator